MKQTWNLTTAQRDSIPSLYASGLTSTDIAKGFGVSVQSIAQLLKRRGIITRPRLAIFTCHHQFFDHIDTEAAAYWLGFLTADAHLSFRAHSAPVLVLALASKDREHVAAFRSAIGATHPLRDYCIKARYWHTRINLTSRAFADALCRHWGGQSLKPTRKFPAVNDDMAHHFMRGYFDGDGSITPPEARNPIFTVVGYPDFLREYQAHLIAACDLNQTKWGWRLGTPSMVYVGRTQLKRIRAYLYRDATIFLARKKARFDAL